MPATQDLTYGSYLALDELLALQRPWSAPVNADELLFIVVHEASEMWCKVILHELDRMSLRLRKLARTPLLATGRYAPYVTGR